MFSGKTISIEKNPLFIVSCLFNKTDSPSMTLISMNPFAGSPFSPTAFPFTEAETPGVKIVLFDSGIKFILFETLNSSVKI